MAGKPSYDSLKKQVEDLKSRLKSTEQNLEKAIINGDRAKAVVGVNPNPIVIYDMDGQVEYLNEAFIKIFGWELEELKGKKLDFVPKENLPETIAGVKRLMAGEHFEFDSRR